jgi:hypothetical protein
MPSPLETITELRTAATSGTLGQASTSKLETYAAALCHPNAFGEFGSIQFPQICETVRVHLLRAHIESLQSHVVELHNHITALNKSNATIQWWVIALAVAALIAAAAQTTVAILPYAGISPSALTPAPTPIQSPPKESSKAAPTQAAPQSSGQATKNAP